MTVNERMRKIDEHMKEEYGCDEEMSLEDVVYDLLQRVDDLEVTVESLVARMDLLGMD